VQVRAGSLKVVTSWCSSDRGVVTNFGKRSQLAWAVRLQEYGPRFDLSGLRVETIMLSLGKLVTGQARYHLEQADSALTRAAAVSSGVEDYYLGGAEAAGVWAGAGAAALGLRGTVGGVALNRVLTGEHPATGEPLGRVLAARRPGFDLTFSAPKSVSVLFGVGDDELRGVLPTLTSCSPGAGTSRSPRASRLTSSGTRSPRSSTSAARTRRT
jgi:TrwC relaxase